MFKGARHKVILSMTLAALVIPGLARAACVNPGILPTAGAAVRLKPAVFRIADSLSRPMQINFDDEQSDQPAIVGLWKFEMLFKSTSTNTNPVPDGTLFDFGVTAWHSDGTELMNSGGRDPKDGDFCQGVWTQVGPSTFELFHYPLAWTNGAYVGPIVLRARVTVDRTGKHYSGMFVGTAYQATPTPGHEFDQTTPLGTITGTITATKITVD